MAGSSTEMSRNAAVEVVRRQHERGAERRQEGAHGLLAHDVETDDRLVEEQHLWF